MEITYNLPAAQWYNTTQPGNPGNTKDWWRLDYPPL